MLTIHGKNVRENISAHVLKAMKGGMKMRKMFDKQLARWEKTRNIGEGIREIKAGRAGRHFTAESFPIVRAVKRSR